MTAALTPLLDWLIAAAMPLSELLLLSMVTLVTVPLPTWICSVPVPTAVLVAEAKSCEYTLCACASTMLLSEYVPSGAFALAVPDTALELLRLTVRLLSWVTFCRLATVDCRLDSALCTCPQADKVVWYVCCWFCSRVMGCWYAADRVEISDCTLMPLTNPEIDTDDMLHSESEQYPLDLTTRSRRTEGRCGTLWDAVRRGGADRRDQAFSCNRLPGGMGWPASCAAAFITCSAGM